MLTAQKKRLPLKLSDGSTTQLEKDIVCARAKVDKADNCCVRKAAPNAPDDDTSKREVEAALKQL